MVKRKSNKCANYEILYFFFPEINSHFIIILPSIHI